MNSVKYNNWKDAVCAHAPGGFNANAAWDKFQQRDQPSRKRKKWLPWLAAACICGVLLSVFIINSNDKKPVVERVDRAVPAKNNIVQQPASTQAIVQPEKNEGHGQPSFIKTASSVQKEKTKLPGEEKTAVPVPETPVTIAQLIPENNSTPVIVKVEPVKETPKETVKPALKVVHINNLDARPDYAQQNIPQPERRATPKMPLMKPSYANYEPEENTPPAVKQPKGLLRSVASLKEN